MCCPLPFQNRRYVEELARLAAVQMLTREILKEQTAGSARWFRLTELRNGVAQGIVALEHLEELFNLAKEAR